MLEPMSSKFGMFPSYFSLHCMIDAKSMCMQLCFLMLLLLLLHIAVMPREELVFVSSVEVCAFVAEMCRELLLDEVSDLDRGSPALPKLLHGYGF